MRPQPRKSSVHSRRSRQSSSQDNRLLLATASDESLLHDSSDLRSDSPQPERSMTSESWSNVITSRKRDASGEITPHELPGSAVRSGELPPLVGDSISVRESLEPVSQ